MGDIIPRELSQSEAKYADIRFRFTEIAPDVFKTEIENPPEIEITINQTMMLSLMDFCLIDALRAVRGKTDLVYGAPAGPRPEVPRVFYAALLQDNRKTLPEQISIAMPPVQIGGEQIEWSTQGNTAIDIPACTEIIRLTP